MNNDSYERIANALERILASLERSAVTPPVDGTAVLQARADSNRDNAGERYRDELVNGADIGMDAGRWYTRDGHEQVVFTPYGWRTDSELDDYLR